LDPHAPPTCDPSPNEKVAFLPRGGAYRSLKRCGANTYVVRVSGGRPIETRLAGTLRTLARNTGIARPWAETPTHVITMAFDPDLDVAAASDLREMIVLVERATGLSAADAYSLCSIAADTHVTQLVNLHKGIHVMLAKSALQKPALQQT
jgi:acetamidase/formamidase